ncbi:hypothetical protein F5Y14DRAFT_406378 [Nemania sp. NC0429]|nr:hypothetical protein F5Y14DRAFT_406378 [Nemania sp. NC0429]
MNSFDLLQHACQDHQSYPENLLRKGAVEHSIREYKEFLNERSKHNIFQGKPSPQQPSKIRVWDRFDGEQVFPTGPHVCKSEEDVRNHFVVNGRKDPRCRIIFLRPSHSRAPLNFSREMFSTVLSYHQVMAQFLDISLNFGTTPGLNIPTAAQHHWFHHQEFLDLENAQRYAIPQLGRSGLDIQYCYNLWGVEKSTDTTRLWEIRQAGIYHSLDLENGRATWIHVKAYNPQKLLENRIREASTASRRHQDIVSDSEHLQESLCASLVIHLNIFEWAREGWRQYILHWEIKLEQILTKINNAPINKAEMALSGVNPAISDVLGSASRRGTWSLKTRANTLDSVTVVASPTISSSPRALSPIRTNTILSNSEATDGKYIMKDAHQGIIEESSLHVLEEFKFEDLQYLHYIASKFREADMVFELNTRIILEVMNYFEGLVKHPLISEDIRKGCDIALADFSQHTRSIISCFGIYRTRIATLLTLLEDGRSLFYATTQFRDVELNKFSASKMENMTIDMHQMTADMHDSTLKMEKIAEGTGKETSSMHTITLVTLLFLPGTFVATFLGAGFYQFPNKAGDGAGDVAVYPLFQPGFFALFAAIAFPLTALTVFFWFIGPWIWRWAQLAELMQRLSQWRWKHLRIPDEESNLTPQVPTAG